MLAVDSRCCRLLAVSFLFFLALPLFSADNTVNSDTMVQETLDWKGWTTIIILVGTLIALVLEIRPPHITMLVGSSLLMLTGILTPQQYLRGFSNEVILTIAMLCIVVRAIEVNGILEIVSKKVLSHAKSLYRQMLSLVIPVSAASAFINNTPIVLLMEPIVRKWALENKQSPSKFLIPLSYATILGGICTIIGTSTNIIVANLVHEYQPKAALEFFELAWIGIPCVIVGLAYLTVFGPYILPNRFDPMTSIAEQTREFTAEFLVEEGCPLIDKRIKEVSGKYFPEEYLVQIERGNTLIDSPARDFIIRQGDRVVFAGDINHIAELHAIEGLQSLADPRFKLDLNSSHFSEVVVSASSLLSGKTLRNLDFRRVYGASVLAVYRQGQRVPGVVGDIVLHPGDTLMLLTSEAWHPDETFTKDFYFIRNSEKLLVFQPVRATLVITSLAFLVLGATIFDIPISLGATAAAFFLIVIRSISMREAQKSIAWTILFLIAFSFAFGKAIEVTGVAAYFAKAILKVVGSSPHALIGGILLISILGTEILSNNAAALIFFPIAIQIAHFAGYDSIEAIRSIGVSVALGSSCGFAFPTGYQTHMIVYGSGGYKFTDFLKAGIPLDIMIWMLGTLLIPLIWPLNP